MKCRQNNESENEMNIEQTWHQSAWNGNVIVARRVKIGEMMK